LHDKRGIVKHFLKSAFKFQIFIDGSDLLTASDHCESTLEKPPSLQMDKHRHQNWKISPYPIRLTSERTKSLSPIFTLSELLIEPLPIQEKLSASMTVI